MMYMNRLSVRSTTLDSSSSCKWDTNLCCNRVISLNYHLALIVCTTCFFIALY